MVEFKKLAYNVTEKNVNKKMEQTKALGLVPQRLAKGECFEINFVIGNVATVTAKIAPNQFKKVQNQQGQTVKQIIGFASQIRTTDNKIDPTKFECRGEAAQGVLKRIWDCVMAVKSNCNLQEHKIMTRKEAMSLVNESLIDQDEKFTREINALFNQKEAIELLQTAYDTSDDTAKMSLMDATEKQFLDKYAKKGSGDEEDGSESDNKGDSEDDFLADGADLDDDGSEEDGSDNTNDDNGGGERQNSEPSGDDANPFAAFGNGGGEQQSSNPFESKRAPKNAQRLNESETPKNNPSRFIRRKK